MYILSFITGNQRRSIKDIIFSNLNYNFKKQRIERKCQFVLILKTQLCELKKYGKGVFQSRGGGDS